MRHNVFNVIPPTGTAKYRKNTSILAFGDVTDKTGLGRPGITGLAVKLLFPVKKQDLVVTL